MIEIEDEAELTAREERTAFLRLDPTHLGRTQLQARVAAIAQLDELALWPLALLVALCGTARLLRLSGGRGSSLFLLLCARLPRHDVHAPHVARRVVAAGIVGTAASRCR